MSKRDGHFQEWLISSAVAVDRLAKETRRWRKRLSPSAVDKVTDCCDVISDVFREALWGKTKQREHS